MDVVVDGEAGGPPRLQATVEAPPGVTVLFGASGAGKSTCLVTIAGLLRPSRGRIALGGEVLVDVARGIHLQPERRRVALVFQSLALFPHLTALENVGFGMPRARRRQERAAQAHHWLERMRVAHLAARRPATFSGGEAQRVAIARALASEPRVLLLDEPFSAMDLPLRQELGRELSALVEELRLPTVLVTHDHDDARRLGARMVVLSQGQVVAQGRPAEVLAAS
ncbi:MAG: ATP-binding cassette domain-containing protein [Myxococcales bacterium]